MENINWGMIGVGDVTEVKSGPAFYKCPNSALIAVASRTYDKALDYARRHNVKTVYRDAEDLLLDPAVSIVYIATPPSTHSELAIRAMRAGKDVYVEKPMALTLSEAEEMVKVSIQTGRRLFVAFYRRSLPYFEKVKELLDQQKIGDLLTVSVRLIRAPLSTDLHPATHTWRIDKKVGGEGYFVDLAPHTLDILDYLIAPIKDAHGRSDNLAGHYEVADTVSAVWKHSNGVLGSAIWCFVANESSEQDEIVITGTQGQLVCSTFNFRPIELLTSRGKTLFDYERPTHIQQHLINTIVQELRGEGICPSTGQSALRTTSVMDAILRNR
ncbi:Gfo/Idh/MocA family protein [Sphingobacterium griseoflavum]|uniref:Oxidoreductase n=1 Tax=Sphingobacterium griseoflavum TaxID=1474952 RepID=A0ABQ3HX83_9SPHI|nr:Gfo/Idh/MocA family oxidoreductase [Sphingobacterium griseoflavum]GHE42533.1 oxidoreductase [Sphingobacterium griseoflavum]